jgi:hypothetical protein
MNTGGRISQIHEEQRSFMERPQAKIQMELQQSCLQPSYGEAMFYHGHSSASV